MENFKIVVVDDEPIIKRTLCQILHFSLGAQQTSLRHIQRSPFLIIRKIRPTDLKRLSFIASACCHPADKSPFLRKTGVPGS